jgi:hypothetical protein
MDDQGHSVPSERVDASTPDIKAVLRAIGLLLAASARFARRHCGRDGGMSALRRWPYHREKSRRALAALGDDQISNLSEIGRRIRTEERRARRSAMR